MRKFIAVMLSVAVLSFAGVAQAQEAAVSGASRSSINGPSLFLVLPYGWGYNGIGAGVRWASPLGTLGLFDGSNVDIYEQFALEYGADVWVLTGANEFMIAPTLGVMWVFWLLDGRLGLYPKLDLALRIYTGGFRGTWLDVDGAGGIIYKTGNLTLRAEGGDSALRLGVGLAF